MKVKIISFVIWILFFSMSCALLRKYMTRNFLFCHVQVQASSTIGLLQSDIKAALKSAFSSADGPLSVTDWCKGRNPSNESSITSDGHSSESVASASECRDSSSTVTLSVGDPMSPSLTSAGGASGLKGNMLMVQ